MSVYSHRIWQSKKAKYSVMWCSFREDFLSRFTSIRCGFVQSYSGKLTPQWMQMRYRGGGCTHSTQWIKTITKHSDAWTHFSEYEKVNVSSQCPLCDNSDADVRLLQPFGEWYNHSFQILCCFRCIYLPTVHFSLTLHFFHGLLFKKQHQKTKFLTSPLFFFF